MSRVVHIFSVKQEHTTARYFERATRAEGNEVVYWDKPPNPTKFQARDLFLFVDPAPDWPIGLERASCTTAAYLIDVHQDLASRLRLSKFFDVVFVVQRDFVSAFEKAGHRNVHWLPLACDPEVHSHPEKVRRFDVGFVGKLGLKGTWRHTVLTSVLPRYETNEYHSFYSPRAMGEVYGQSKIVFNASINGDLNMRFFEALASGALLVTDKISNGVEMLFVEGQHYVGYSDVQEAMEKVDYYLAHPGEREKIAAAGKELALASHTYRHRWDELARLAAISERQAPARLEARAELGKLYAEVFVGLRKPFRIRSVLREYGSSLAALSKLLVASGRWLNARVPVTPNAIRARLRSR